jgi:hypothetical protein
MSAHAIRSPSKRARWMLCPGSVREESKYPEERSGASAIDGTHTHSLLEWCLKGPDNSIRDPRDQIGQTMTDHDGDFQVDGQRAMRVQFALDYIMNRKIAINCHTLHSEQKIKSDLAFGRDDLSGTADVQLWGDDVLEIIDYKDGMGVVSAQNNPQLEQCAVLALSGREPPKTIRMTIIQPKLRDKGMPGIEWSEISDDEIKNIRFQILMEAMTSDAPDAPLVPGEKQCQYCRHKGACSALANQNLASVGITFDDLSQQTADKEPTHLSDEKIKEIMLAAPLIRQMLEGVEAEALRRFNAGHTIAGLKMVRGRGSRAWAFDEDAMAEKLKKMGLPKDVVWKTSLISPAQAEKATWEKKDGTRMQLSERQLKLLKTEYITQKDGKLTVVPEADERSAVTLSVAGMFAPVEAETLPDFLK